VEFTEISLQDKGRLESYINHSVENIRTNRFHVRCPMAAKVKYRLQLEPQKKEYCESADIGSEGMKLYLREDVSLNSRINITFDIPNGRGELTAEGVVVWKGQERDGIRAIGLKFTDIMLRDKKRIMRFINYILSQK